MARSDLPGLEAPEAASTLADDEVLYRNERTLIARRHLADGRTVIVKNAFGADAQARLRHEAAILQRLGTVKGVIRLAPEQEHGAIVFQDLHADSLAKLLAIRRLGLDQAVRLAVELAHILARVHRAGVIHKDINPSNVLLEGPDQHPVLIDFNIATCFAQEQQGFTHQSHIVGTLAYMSPEQTGRTGRAVDQRSDLYALGVTLYELFPGRKPFESEDLLEMIHDHLVRPAVPPSKLEAEIPEALSDIILRLLEKEADRRYQSAEGLARDLIRLQETLAKGQQGSFPLGQDDFPMRLTPPCALIGRQDEIAVLQQAIDRTSVGEGRALLISGAPGVGKSALINELQPMVTARRGWFVSGKFEQYQRDTTSAFVQALRALGRLLLAEPEAQLARHRERILMALGANAGIGPSLLPEFKLLLGKLPTLQIDDPVEAETRMIQATVDMLTSVVSPEQPLVMVVDDLQWAPAISLRFMDALMTRERELQGLLVVGAYREKEVDSAHPLGAMLQRWASLGVSPPIMGLKNLPQSDVGALIGKMLRLPGTEASRLSAAVIERTEGNPYDTVELINALRQDGLLWHCDGTWQWHEAAIRQYVGDCDVVGLLGRRIDRLPLASQALLEILACLGGEVNMALMEVATGLDTATLETQLVPALEDGLIVSHTSHHEREIRFRHDRVQQAMHERMLADDDKPSVKLSLARRLAGHPQWSALAAKQYLPAHGLVNDEAECRFVIELFQQAADVTKVINYDLCERFLSAAISLTSRITMEDADRPRMFALQASQHAALYGLGRLEDADAVYDTLVAGAVEPIDLVEPTAAQIASLCNRSRPKDATSLGLDLLKALGMPQPEDIKLAIGAALFKVAAWNAAPDKAQDLTRDEVSDPRILALSKVISKTQVASFFSSPKIGAWLTMESHALWVEHGPCASLMTALCSMPVQLIAICEDYQGGHAMARHLLTVGEARGYEPATSVARFMFAISSAHWFEALEDKLHHYRKAREDLLQAGELQYALFTFDAWTVQFDIAPSLDTSLEEIEGGFAMATRNGDKHFLHVHRSSRQLYRTLHGDIDPALPPGSFDDADFSESAYEASLSAHNNAGAYYHNSRALAAAVFNDEAALIRHATAGMPLIPRIPGYYLLFRSHLLYALAMCRRLASLADEDKATALADIDKSLKWMRKRAQDAPFNYLHLQQWIEAERAWATGDFWAATSGFNEAMDEAGKRSRPWHAALITERAGRFHLSQGMVRTGHPLIWAALEAYDAWGAKAKVAQLVSEFPDLRPRQGRKSGANARSTIVSTDMVDLVSVLRASQALSSETNLASLNERVNKVLSAMTGAATVLLAVRVDDPPSWQVLADEGDGRGSTTTVALETAGAQGRLPLSAFRYAERTCEPLLLSDATTDERFSRDPYFNGVSQCAMLLLPVLSKGRLRAMLLLENRLSRGAFSSDRLDAVSLIAGQLSVSLDNALLYASLEQKVAERTAALEAANQRLEMLSSTDALTGVSNRRKFNETFEAEWQRASRTKQPIGLILIDIDHFKLYNDHYGHQGGDTCLQLVAAAMRTALRSGSDLIARYGGEEFVLLLPNIDIEGACVVAERVRKAIEARQEPHAKSAQGIVTISVGVTSFVPTQDAKPGHHIEVADQALYTAKREGRNRVCRAG